MNGNLAAINNHQQHLQLKLVLNWKFWPEYLCAETVGKKNNQIKSFILRGDSDIQWCSRAALLTRKTVNGVVLNLQFPYKCQHWCSRVRQNISCELSHTQRPVQLCRALITLTPVGERWLWGRRAILSSFSVISCDKAAISLIGMIPNKPLNIVLYNLQAFKEGSLLPLELPEQPWHFIYKSF